jgi:hypothetical protein
MSDFPFTSLVMVIGTLFLVVIGAWLTNRLSYHRQNKERFWEYRRLAYDEILSQLTNVEHVLDGIDDKISHLAERAHFAVVFSGEHDNKRIREFVVADRRRVSEDYLILLSEFVCLVEKLLIDLDRYAPDLDTPEQHEHFAKAARAVRLRLLQQARCEL